MVISGLGAVTGFGLGAGVLWDALCEGRSALRRMTRLDPSGMAFQGGAEVRDFSARDHVPKHYRKAVKVMARDIELAVGAAKAAVEDAKIITGAAAGDDAPGATPVTPTYPRERIGCQIGAGLIAAEVPELTAALATARDESGRFSYERWGAGGMENLTPLWLLKYLPNMLACHVTIIHEACGPSNTITCGEASGLLSIGESMRIIERGAADLCFAGGAESKINHLGLMRLHLAGRLAPVKLAPGEEGAWKHVRPYDAGAIGGMAGEGAGIVILEALETARARGAEPVAELLGFGAGHSPMTGGARRRSEGLKAALENALDDAGVRPDQIDAIVPHGAGVKSVDDEELEALRAVFADRLGTTPLVTLAPNIGETMAGAGGLAVCVGAMCLKRQMIPARLHGGAPAAGVLAGSASPRDMALSRIVVCTNSFAGQNAAVVLGRARVG